MIEAENTQNQGEISVSSVNSPNNAVINIQTQSQTTPVSSEFDTQTGALKTVTESSKITEKLPDFYQVGDKYIDLVLNNPRNTRVLVNVSELNDVYTAGEGIAITNKVISAVFPDTEWGDIVGSLQDQIDLQTALNGKQAVISDLSDIRSGAGLGATALQSSDVDLELSLSSSNPVRNSIVTSALNEKCKKDGTNAEFPVVVESYVNGNSGYILYSPDENGNKRCIQWGVQAGTGVTGQTTVYLLKPLQLPYVVTAQIEWSNVSSWYTGSAPVYQAGATDITGLPSDKTNATFLIQSLSTHSWYIDGYLYEV